MEGTCVHPLPSQGRRTTAFWDHRQGKKLLSNSYLVLLGYTDRMLKSLAVEFLSLFPKIPSCRTFHWQQPSMDSRRSY